MTNRIEWVGVKIQGLINRFKKQGLILMYHRVASFLNDPQLLAVSPENFEQHLAYLKKYFYPISLSQLHTSIIDNTLINKSVVITFDDGYIDNLENAVPLLKKYTIPATIFVTSGFVDVERETPSDILEYCLLTPPIKYEPLTITINDKTYHWNLSTEIETNDISWNVTKKSLKTPHQECYLNLHAILRPLSFNDRNVILEQLQAWAGMREARAKKRIVNNDSLLSLAACDLIEIGSHGVNHLMLSKQSIKDQIYEISYSKQELEKVIKKSVRYFAYPYGGKDAVNTQTVSLIQDTGFSAACSTDFGTTTINANPYLLPRFCIRNWGMGEFARGIERAFRGKQ